MIEDDRELCSAVSFRLEQEGFSVTLCHDGEEGLYYMQETPYDLVILDRMLPHMNGIEVLKEARSRQIKTPVIILTALGELNDRLTGLNCGADDYMVKPFAFEELLARIRCLLRRPAAYNPAADAVSLGDVTFYTRKTRRPFQRQKGLYPFQPGGRPYGSISPQSRTDTSPPASSYKSLGT